MSMPCLTRGAWSAPIRRVSGVSCGSLRSPTVVSPPSYCRANTNMYQPYIYEYHIRKLYFLAKKQGLSMVTLLNAIIATAVHDEPDPPPDERYLQGEVVGVELGSSTGAHDVEGKSVDRSVVADSKRPASPQRSRRSRVR